jgi:putative glutamine amidotransferase
VKIVAVSQRLDRLHIRNEVRDALDQRVIAFLIAAGFIPAPLPNGLCIAKPGGQHDRRVLDSWLTAVKPDAIFLSGGNDIGEELGRDLTEESLLDYARAMNLPLLGVCRGMQMMAQYAGAALKPVHGHILCRHQISGEITGERNSYHKFSVAKCPNSFDVLARSSDGEIEAIRHRSLPWEGWMWHPEREDSFSPIDIARLRDLIK